MKKLFPAMWLAFTINLISGTGLAVAATATTLPNPMFIAKITCVLAAVAVLRVLQVRVFRDPELENKPVGQTDKILAATLLVLWLLGMITGRVIAYDFFAWPRIGKIPSNQK